MNTAYSPNVISQISALIGLLLAIFTFFISKVREKIHWAFKLAGTFLVFWLFIISGFSFSVSGRQNAFVLQWYILPIQTLAFNPAGDITKIHYSKTDFSLKLTHENNDSLFVLSQPFLWGVDLDAAAKGLQQFGVPE